MTRLLLLIACTVMLAGCGKLVPQANGAQATRPASTTRPVAVSPTNRACLAQLGDSGARFTPLPDRYFEGGCSNLGTIQLDGLRGDRSAIGVTHLGATACTTAAAFAGWARYGVDRAAREYLGSGVTRIETMGSYSCRNVAGSSKLSAHGKAQAIDVSGFILDDGRRITITDGWNSGDSRTRKFLRAIHTSACRRFGTVLGPEYNRAHHDHLHLEQGGGGFCR